MRCYKYKNHIVLKDGEIWSVWKSNIKIDEFVTERAALKFIENNKK